MVAKNHYNKNKVILVPEEILEISPFDYGNNDYEKSIIKDVVVNEVWSGFAEEIQEAITRIWIPTYTEMGFAGSSYAEVEGKAFPWFDSDEKRKRKHRGYARWYWLSTPGTGSSSSAWYVLADGTSNGNSVSYHYGVVPALEI